MNRIILFACLALASLCTACEEKIDSVIPNSRVEVQILKGSVEGTSFDRDDYVRLTAPGNLYPYIGYGGVLIVKGYNPDMEVFAFDLSCPVERSRTVRLEVKDNYKGICPQCKSEFDMIRYGNPSPTSGTAREQRLRLRQYNAFYSDSNYSITAYN